MIGLEILIDLIIAIGAPFIMQPFGFKWRKVYEKGLEYILEHRGLFLVINFFSFYTLYFVAFRYNYMIGFLDELSPRY